VRSHLPTLFACWVKFNQAYAWAKLRLVHNMEERKTFLMGERKSLPFLCRAALDWSLV
jgi:hypothetical protein